MENTEEPKSTIIKRLMARLPHNKEAENLAAIRAIAEEDDINHISFEFKEIQDTRKNTFIPTPYNEHETRESCWRYPRLYTGRPSLRGTSLASSSTSRPSQRTQSSRT
jgi:hypothetical protein